MKEKKKCILISTPLAQKTLSRGILSMATFLESRGYSTEIIPLSYYLGFREKWSFKEVGSILKDFIQNADPILVGVSNQFTGDYPTCIEILKICKQLNENVVTVIGGVHVTFLDAECLKLPHVDIVVRGEGEWTLLDLIAALENKTDLQNVKGITFRKNGKIIRNPDRPMGDLNKLPPTDFTLLPPEFIQNIFVHGMLNRGCSFNCSFCGESAFWKKRRYFPVRRIIEEMESLDRVYKNPMHGIDDSMLYIGSEQFIEMSAEIITHKIRLQPDFYIMSRVDSFDEHALENVERAGIRFVTLGIESASPKVLKMMNKKTSRDAIISCCVKLRENNLKPWGSWIIGHPGDSPSEAEYSLELLEHLLKQNLMERVGISVFVPCPGTVFFEQPEKYGIEILTDDWSEWNQYHTKKPVCQLKDFPADEIMRYYIKAQEIVNLNKPGANKRML